jgi:hypothetical protein
LEVSFVRDMESSPELAHLPLSDRCTISWNVG